MTKNQNELDNKIPIIIGGASGFVGMELTKHISKINNMNIVGAISSPNSKYLNRDVGEVAGIGKLGVEISNNVKEVLNNAPAGCGLIDFSLANGALDLAPAIAEMGSVYVVCTTGHTLETQKAINAAAKKIPVIQSSNMSFALIVLAELAKKASQLLNEADWDISITESHRKGKKDRPSGTAKMLETMMVSDSNREIEIISSRRKNIVGEHDVYFEGMNERIVLSHHVRSRKAFAAGAVKACIWGLGKPPKLYNMRDVVGFNETN